MKLRQSQGSSPPADTTHGRPQLKSPSNGRGGVFGSGVLRCRILRLALLCIALAAVCFYLDSNNQAFNALEAHTVSWRMGMWESRNIARVREAYNRIRLVAITDDTFNRQENSSQSRNANRAFTALGGPPLPRNYHAILIRELQRGGAKVIAFDFVFDIPRAPDRELAAAARSFRNVVWGCLWDIDKLLLPNPQLRAASSHLGHMRTPHQSSDMMVERIEVAIKSGGAYVPALSVETVHLALGGKPGPIVRSGQRWKIGTYMVPTDSENTFRINYFGKAGSFPIIPYERIYYGAARQGMYKDAQFFKDKIVIVGDITEVSSDQHKTPVGQMSGLEIHANATASLLLRSFLKEPSRQTVLLIMACLMAGACFVASKFQWLLAAGATCGLLFAYFLLAIWLFTDADTIVPVAMPTMAALGAAVATVFERGRAEERERADMKKVLDQYVSTQVSAHGPPTGELALVFTDLEGSSVLSRRFGEQFEKVRNRHFEILRDVVKKWNGFEVETAGDSLFAVFAQAPDAVQFAVEAQHRLAAYPWPDVMGHIRIRIGMHYGKPFVRQDRTRLTFRGHETNRTARVMGTAEGGQILLTEELKTVIPPGLLPDIEFAHKGIFDLKGTGQEALYEVKYRGDVKYRGIDGSNVDQGDIARGNSDQGNTGQGEESPSDS